MAGMESISALSSVLGGLNPAGNTNPVESVDEISAASGAATVKSLPVNQQAADQANVSSVGGLVAQVSATSDVRTEKVAQLQAAIASGSYHVSSEDVASKIVEHLLG
jgi:negative regulator of flagellin synthesis FlgM